MLQNGTIIQNKYKILRTIGIGGMSVVYLAEDRYRKQYAIKDVEKFRQDRDSNIVAQSLIAEGSLLKRLSNPHLPAIYDIIEDHNRIMLVSDYISGKSLDVVIKERGPQRAEDIYDWCIQICDVLGYLHHQNPPIIYRDLKPSNLILKPDGTIVLIDFGTARTEKVGEDLPSDTICIGTAGFAAPEQYGGYGQSDARTDIFCLGATMYNMVTGHSPCDPPQGIMPLATFNPALADTPLDRIITRCVQAVPALRYQTAMDLRADLQKARQGTFQQQVRSDTSTWMEQSLKGAEGSDDGLSGLLTRGKSVLLRPKAQVEEAPPENTGGEVWGIILLISVAAAFLFLITSVVCTFFGEEEPALMALVAAILFVILAIIGLVKSHRQRKPAKNARMSGHAGGSVNAQNRNNH